MLADKLTVAKEAIEAAIKTASETFAEAMPIWISKRFLSYLSGSVDLIVQSFNESSSEAKLYLLSYSLMWVCRAIVALYFDTPNLADLNIRGVLVQSALKNVKKAQSLIKTANKFALISPDEEEPKKYNYIQKASLFIDSSIYILCDIEKEITIELSNALILISSAITCSASEVALAYASVGCIFDSCDTKL